MRSSRQDNTRGTICFTSHPGTVEGVGDQEAGHHTDKHVRDPLVLRGRGVLGFTGLSSGFGLEVGGSVDIFHVGGQGAGDSNT